MADRRLIPTNPRNPEYPELRRRLYREQDGLCYYCKRPVRLAFKGMPHENPDHATIDHKVPRNLGGTDDVANIVVACWSCNSVKGDMTAEQFTRLIEARRRLRRA
jgi:5-methylcytosine-specific restriction endonuclease McrA